MKKLILLELTFLFLATTFSSNSPPPGWYQQTLPVSDNINDIFFLDSLNGWLVTPNGHILMTANGGDNWDIQKDSAGNLYSVQFLNSLTGYVLGNGLHGIIYKTTTAGLIWNLIHDFSPAGIFTDMSFINQDTGWVCSADPFDGGVFRTTDGGFNWNQQFNYGTENPNRIFFINKDTGWTSNGSGRKLYKTINGGANWNHVYTSSIQIQSLFFLNGQKGWMRGGPNTNTNGASYTTDGGFTWISSTGENTGFDVKFVNDSIGYAGGGFEPFRITKSTDGGKTWGYQTALVTPDISVAILKKDTLLAWAGEQVLNHTTDGGGVIVNVKQTSSELPRDFILYQNHPNPFNPVTNLEFSIPKSGLVSLKIYDMLGKVVAVIVESKLNSGTYKYEFDGGNFTSGIYFYRIETSDIKSNIINSETKKMILTK
ncbi:MAG: T9SS type A sorting domain-containing protein [Bacteroidetes bacterium]|nr:T9SS type A sorting domain-containing protein [Bacteroidota bacterium]